MRLGKTGKEKAANMKRIIVLPDGTRTTMTEVAALIDKNAGDNAPYANGFATDAFFANDFEKLAQLIEALQENWMEE